MIYKPVDAIFSDCVIVPVKLSHIISRDYTEKMYMKALLDFDKYFHYISRISQKDYKRYFAERKLCISRCLGRT